MDLEKLKPWNWFKHEENMINNGSLSVTRNQSADKAGTHHSPGSLLGLHRDMDRWFDDAFRSFGMPSLMTDSSMSKLYRPQIDVSADDNHYEIALDVPDMSESDLDVEVKDDILMIKGQKEERTEKKDKHFYRVERSCGSFQRTLSLPDDANADEISADLNKGVLRLSIPRRQTAAEEVKRVSISS